MNTDLVEEINKLAQKVLAEFESTNIYSYVKHVLEPFYEISNLLQNEIIDKELIIRNTYGIGYMVLDNYSFSRSKSGKEILKLCKKIRNRVEV